MTLNRSPFRGVDPNWIVYISNYSLNGGVTWAGGRPWLPYVINVEVGASLTFVLGNDGSSAPDTLTKSMTMYLCLNGERIAQFPYVDGRFILTCPNLTAEDSGRYTVEALRYSVISDKTRYPVGVQVGPKIAPAAPTITPNYAAETIGTTTDMEYSTDSQDVPDADKKWTACTADMSVAEMLGVYDKIFVRLKETQFKLASLPAEVSLACMPVSVSFNAERQQFDGLEGVVCKLPGAASYTAPPSAPAQAGIYTFRTAATATSFGSAPQTISIHRLTFDAKGGMFDDGSATAVRYAEDGGKFAMPTVPTPPGEKYKVKHWKYWYESNESEIYFASKQIENVTGNCKFEAVWQKGTRLTFEGNGGIFDGDAAKTSVDILEQAGTALDGSTVPTPALTGYDFAGWTDTNGQDAALPSAFPENDATYKAKWTLHSYKIEYNLALGSQPPGGYPATYTIESPSFALTAPTRAHYDFAGWTVTGADPAITGGINLTIPKGTHGDLTVTASWTPSKYAIAYITDNLTVNAVGNPTEYTIESGALTIGIPKKTGYRFTGWTVTETDTGALSSISGGTGGEVTIPAGSVGNLTFAANFVEGVYEVKFVNPDGAVIRVENLKYGTAMAGYIPTKDTDPDALIKRGAAFTGNWNPVVPATAPDADVTYTAIWTTNVYGVAYDLDKGTIPDASANKTTFTIFDTFTLTNPTRAHYDFAGWLVTEDGDSVRFVTLSEDRLTATVEKDTVPANGNALAFKATWLPHAYTIAYDLNDTSDANAAHNGAGNPVSYNVQSAAFGIAVPTRRGYTFTGWTVTGAEASIAGGTAVTIPSGTAGDLTLTASWTPTGYRIEYNGGGSIPDGGTNPTTFNVTTATFTLLNPIRTGYRFTGWRVAAGGDAIQTVAGGLSAAVRQNTVPADGSRLVFEAGWEAIRYTITYALGSGAANGAGNPATYTIESDAIRINIPAKRGYTFGSWIIENADGGASSFTPDADKIVTVPTGTYGNLIFTATGWQIATYHIHYEAETGAALDSTNPSSYTVESPALTIGIPKKTGYRFTGWTVTETDTGALSSISGGTGGEVTIPAGSVGNLTFAANFVEGEYTLIFKDPDGTVIRSRTYKYGAAIAQPTDDEFNPDRGDGNLFKGWKPEAGTDTPSLFPATMPDFDLTYVSDWTLKEYTVTYYYNDGTPPMNGNPGKYTIFDDFDLAKPTKAHCDFVYWFETADLNGDGAPEEKPIERISGTEKRNVTVYAKWTPHRYVIRFVDPDELGGKTWAYLAQEFGTNVVAPSPEKAGYEFKGWDTAVPGTMPDTNPDGAITITAVWQILTYGLTYDLDGGSVAENANRASYDVTTPTFTLTNPTKTGYIFRGWCEAGGEPRIQVAILQGSTGARDFKAVWQIKQYTLTVVDEEGNTLETKALDYDTPLNTGILTNPTKNGWLFKAWGEFRDQDNAIVVRMPDGDVTMSVTFWKVLTIVNAQQEHDYVPNSSRTYGDAPIPGGTRAGHPAILTCDFSGCTSVTKNGHPYKVAVTLPADEDFYCFLDSDDPSQPTTTTIIEITVNRVAVVDPDSDADGEVSGGFDPDTTFKIVSVTEQETLENLQTLLNEQDGLKNREVQAAYRFETNAVGKIPVQLRLKYGADPNVKVAVKNKDGVVSEVEHTYAKRGDYWYLIFETDATDIFMILDAQEKTTPTDAEPADRTWLWILLGCLGGALAVGAVAAAVVVVQHKYRMKARESEEYDR